MDTTRIFGYDVSAPFAHFIIRVISSCIFTVVGYSFFGRKIVVRLLRKKSTKGLEEEYLKGATIFFRNDKLSVKIFVNILVAVIAVYFFRLSLSGIGFYDDSVRICNDSTNFQVADIP